MQLGKFPKAPVDRKRYRIDYTDWLDEGELISDVVYVVTLDGVSSAEMTIDGTALYPGNLIAYFYANAGVANRTYKVLVTMTTNSGQIRQDNILFSVKPE